jgi:hypothetical protein
MNHTQGANRFASAQGEMPFDLNEPVAPNYPKRRLRFIPLKTIGFAAFFAMSSVGQSKKM